VFFSPWRDAVVNSSPETSLALSSKSGWPSQRSARFCFRHRNGVSLAGLAERWPSRLVATAAEDRLTFLVQLHTPFAAAWRSMRVSLG